MRGRGVWIVGWVVLALAGCSIAPDRVALEREVLDADRALERAVAEHDVDHVFVALSASRYGELSRVYKKASEVLVEVQLVPDIPLIMLTGNSTIEIYQKALGLGVYEFVSKPVKAKELDRIVKAALDGN